MTITDFGAGDQAALEQEEQSKWADIEKKVFLSNGFSLVKAETPGHYYYEKRGVLVNVITRGTIERMLEPVRSEALAGIAELGDWDADVNDLIA